MSQPYNPEWVRMDCCRCKNSVTLELSELEEEYERTSKVFLCQECEDNNGREI
jgi:hypothetical protein